MAANKRRRGNVVLSGALVVVATVLFSASFEQRWIARALSEISPEVLYFVDTERTAVALTIDDGPDPEATPAILDVLEQHGAHATFFLITERVPGNEALVRRILDEGHEIGNHMTREEPSIVLSAERFERELRAAHEVLTDFAPQRWFRPGSGYFDQQMLDAAKRLGYTTVLGSAYPLDSEIPSAPFAARHILANIGPGSIIVLHDVGERGLRTAATLAAILPELEARGFQVTTLSKLVGAG